MLPNVSPPPPFPFFGGEKVRSRRFIPISVSLRAEHIDWLEEAARRGRKTVSEVVRELIEEKMQKGEQGV